MNSTSAPQTKRQSPRRRLLIAPDAWGFRYETSDPRSAAVAAAEIARGPADVAFVRDLLAKEINSRAEELGMATQSLQADAGKGQIGAVAPCFATADRRRAEGSRPGAPTPSGAHDVQSACWQYRVLVATHPRSGRRLAERLTAWAFALGSAACFLIGPFPGYADLGGVTAAANLLGLGFLGVSGIAGFIAFQSLVFWAWAIGPLGALLAIPLSLLVKALVVDIDSNTQRIDRLINGDEAAEPEVPPTVAPPEPETPRPNPLPAEATT